MLISKVTVGFVCQTFDTELQRFTSQTFVASDDVSYEDDNGDPADYSLMGDNELYLNFDMVQPSDQPNVKIRESLQMSLCVLVDLAQEQVDKGNVAGRQKDIDAVVNMIEECRRQRDQIPTLSLTAYEQVIKDLAEDSNGDNNLLDIALDAIRNEVKEACKA